tara:strand:- start:509 stop:676 length:168 start_codon:yes stop_codon:yes gene_type:complete
MSLAEKVLELEGKYRLLRASVEGVVAAIDSYSENDSVLKVTADHLKEILEKDKLD